MYRPISLPAPRLDGKDAVLLPEIARRGRDDCPLRNDYLSPGLNREPDILFTDEVERRLAGFCGLQRAFSPAIAALTAFAKATAVRRSFARRRKGPR